MEILWFMIVIIAAIVNVVKKAEANGTSASKQKQYHSQNVMERRQQEFNRDMQQKRQQYTARQSPQYTQRQTQSQQELKQRLQQKYNSSSDNYKADEYNSGLANKSAILSRALDNVEETDADIVLQENHAEVCVDYRTNPVAHGMEAHISHSMDCEAYEDSDIMQRVNDLMIMGYSGDLEFDRDFVAEGVDMLNSFGAQ